MGSHFVSAYSLDETKVRAVLGSGDQDALVAWHRAIREQAGLPEATVKAREEAAGQMIAGGVSPGERPDGHHFGYAFLALCRAWADRQAVVECYVTESFRPLWALAAKADPNPFGVPQSPYAAGHVGWHTPAAVSRLRRLFAGARAIDPTLSRFGGAVEVAVALEEVLAHADAAGRGVVVSWAT